MVTQRKSFPSRRARSKHLYCRRQPAFGIWYVDYRVATPADINDSKILRQSFVYMKPVGATPAKKTDGFIFGINSHPERTPTQIDLEAQAISLIGAKVVRFVIGMPNDYRIYDEIVVKNSPNKA